MQPRFSGSALQASPQAQDDLPDKTTNGLIRVDSENVDALYLEPGATLAPYNRVAILDCFVAFRKDWRDDYNRNERALSARVTEKDMEDIKAALSEEFRKVFTEQLQSGGYEVVDEAADDVLLLRPAIVNLDVTAPDVGNATRSYTVVASAGQMTLYLELYDSTTGHNFALILDHQEDNQNIAQRSSTVTNRAAADRIIRDWAVLLRDALDEAHNR